MMSQAGQRPPLPEGVGPAEYLPEADVARVASHFAQKFGSLGEALTTFPSDTEFDLCTFEVQLKKWGVKVDNVVELFDHIDQDWSGTITVQELFSVLALPLQTIQQRGQQIRRNTINRIYEELGRRIREKFGSIEEAFAKHGLPSSVCAEGGVLSIAGFRRLANELNIEFDTAQLHLAYSAMNGERAGIVSLHELQHALSFHLVRDSLVQLADALVRQHSSVTKPFEDHFAIHLGPSPRSSENSGAAVPMTSGSFNANFTFGAAPSMANAMRTASEQHITEEKLFRFLRELKVMNQLGEAGQQSLHDWVARLHREQPLTFAHEFVRLLQTVHTQVVEDRRQKRENEERRELERQKMVQTVSGVNARQRVEGNIAAWVRRVEGSALGRSGTAEGFVQGCMVKVRGGTWGMHLQDHVAELQRHFIEKEAQVQDLEQRLEQETRETEHFRECFGPTPSHQSMRSGDSTPTTPSTACFTPGSRRRKSPADAQLNLTVHQESKALKTERLIQAAAMGDAAKLQRCLEARADVDAVAWGGATALMTAARHGHRSVVELLLARRADASRSDMRGRTALDHARRQLGVAQLLRQRGAPTSQELAREVERCAQRIVDVEGKRAHLQSRLEQLPSADVRERARSRRSSSCFPSQDAAHEAVPVMQIPPPALRRPFSQVTLRAVPEAPEEPSLKDRPERIHASPSLKRGPEAPEEPSLKGRQERIHPSPSLKRGMMGGA